MILPLRCYSFFWERSHRSRHVFTRTIVLLATGVFALVPVSLRAQAPLRPFSMQALSPEFWALFDRDAKVETVARGFGFTEGPMWDPGGFLYVSDETVNKIFRVFPNGRKEEVIALGDPDGNTFDRQHRLIDCASVLRAIIAVTPEGKYKILADHYEGKKFNSPNDVIVGPDGALYFTDPTLDLVAGEKQEIPFQGVYRLDDKGNVRLLTRDITQPNGLAFSPDGKHFYVDDSEQRNIRRVQRPSQRLPHQRPHLWPRTWRERRRRAGRHQS